MYLRHTLILCTPQIPRLLRVYGACELTFQRARGPLFEVVCGLVEDKPGARARWKLRKSFAELFYYLPSGYTVTRLEAGSANARVIRFFLRVNGGKWYRYCYHVR